MAPRPAAGRPRARPRPLLPPSLLALLVGSCCWRLCAATEGSGPKPVVEVFGRQLVVDGKPFHLKGVNWNPVRRGGRNPTDVDFRGFVEADAEIMSLAGVNVVRTYSAIIDPEVLDALWSRSIFVLNSVYVSAEQPIESLIPKVRAVAKHPAVLMWVVGNEWNYNGFYQNLEFDVSRRLLKDAARLVRSEDPTRPVATIYGGLPDNETLTTVGDDIDIWGVNQYEKTTFGPLFENWANLPTSKPMFLSEYGADAYNSLKGRPDEVAQAKATRVLTEEIVANTSQHEGGVCIGGLIFEFADEWWKAGRPGTHDVNGTGESAHGNVYPDETFNEEWWGLVAFDGTQRAAFRAFAEVSSPSCAKGSRRPGCGRDPPRSTSGKRLQACGASEACAGRLGLCCPDQHGMRHGCCPPREASEPARNETRKEQVRSDASEEQWTCNAGFYFQFAGAKSWPAEKRRWCCEHKGVACPEGDEESDEERQIRVAKKFQLLKFWRWIPSLPEHFAAPMTLFLACVAVVACLGIAQALVVRPVAGLAGSVGAASVRRRRQICYGEVATGGQAAEEDLADHRCLAPLPGAEAGFCQGAVVQAGFCQGTPRLLEGGPRLFDV